MGLQKAVQLRGGVTCDYWKIIHIEVDYLRDKAMATMGIYLNKDQRDQGGVENFVQQRTFPLKSAAYDTPAKMYPKLKESKKDPDGNEVNPLFDATDVLEPGPIKEEE